MTVDLTTRSTGRKLAARVSRQLPKALGHQRRRSMLTKIIAIPLVMLFSRAASAEIPKYSIVHGASAVCRASVAYLNRSIHGAFDTQRALGITLLDIPKYQDTPAGDYGTKTDFVLPSPIIAVQDKSFDFNNDGIPDYVFSYVNAGSYIWGTLFYVVLGGQASLPASGSLLDISQLHAFPCQFSGNVTAAACPPISQKSDSLSVNVSSGNTDEWHFSIRYTDITPIQFQDKTYLIMQDNEYKRKYAAVIMPYGNSSYKRECLFKRP